MDTTALVVSLRLALSTTAILLAIGLPLAWWLATTKWRLRHLIDSLVTLPLILPPTVLGFYLLLLFGPRGWVGKLYTSTTGELLPFTFTALLLASVLVNLPFAVRPFVTAFLRVDRRLIEAAHCLGASKSKTFRRIVVPLAWPGIVSGAILTFAHAIGEFGVVLMVGGNIPAVTRTLSISIYDDVQALQYNSAARSAIVLVISAMVLLTFVHSLERAKWRQ